MHKPYATKYLNYAVRGATLVHLGAVIGDVHAFSPALAARLTDIMSDAVQVTVEEFADAS